MLHNLYVKNLALIDEMEVEFHNGLNILTGETGAGKSIILGSINLALGGRYSSDMLRNEDEPGYVELTFFVENESAKGHHTRASILSFSTQKQAKFRLYFRAVVSEPKKHTFAKPWNAENDFSSFR